ncbi:MAG: DUF1492 domain-containing protein [Oscillospiraceae bacterium]|nr:DUF1492 domain-containing protein [Oscillospiraceae bacterium]
MKKADIQRAKDYLKQYARLKEQIQCEQDHIAALRSIVENVTTHLSFTAGRNPSKGKGNFEGTMVDIVVEERKTEERISRLGELQIAIENLIQQVSDEKQQTLLRYRYINGMPFEEIIDEMEISPSFAYKLHRLGLLEIAEKI